LQCGVRAFPPLEIRLPWEIPDGKPTTARLVLHRRGHKALDRHHFNLPTSEQRTRQAVDRALTGGAATADGLPAAQEHS
jgi:hypothetical protein